MNESDKERRHVILILKTEHGRYGTQIESQGTIISRERPEFHPPRSDENRTILIGGIQHGETRYAIIDIKATWRNLRSEIERWYGQINEPEHLSAVTTGDREGPARFGPPMGIQEG
jgi:hypothetical protein